MSKIELLAKIELLNKYEAMVEEMKTQADTIRNEIKAEMEASELEEMIAGQYIVRYTAVLSNRFDTTAFKKVMPEIYKAYTKQVSSLARSTQQLCEIIDTVREKHLRLVIVGSITLDCRSGQPDPMSEAFLQMAGVFSQLELSMIRMRVRSGMAHARAKGKRIGRPQVTVEDLPGIFFRHYPAYQKGALKC